MSEYNLLSLFHRVITGEEYAPPTTTPTNDMAVIEEIDEENEVDEDKTTDQKQAPNGPLFNGNVGKLARVYIL